MYSWPTIQPRSEAAHHVSPRLKKNKQEIIDERGQIKSQKINIFHSNVMKDYLPFLYRLQVGFAK